MPGLEEEIEKQFETAYDFESSGRETEEEVDEDRETPEDSEVEELLNYETDYQEGEVDEDRETPEDSEVEELVDFETTDMEVEEDREVEELVDFETGEKGRYSQVQGYDPEIEKFSERLLQIASNDSSTSYEVDTNIENEVEQFVEDLKKDYFGRFLKKQIKRFKKGYGAIRKFTKTPLGGALVTMLKSTPYGAAVDMATKVLTGPASTYIKNLAQQGIKLANTGVVPSGPAAVDSLKALGIIPGTGVASNQEGLNNIVQVGAETYKQLANQAINNPAATDPAEAPKIAACGIRNGNK